MGQPGDQSADRDIINVGKGDVNVHNYAPLTEIDITLDESPPPYQHWQPRREESQILADLATDVQLIEVLGVGGYGKSALATRVFEQAQGFQKKLWVSFRPLVFGAGVSALSGVWAMVWAQIWLSTCPRLDG